MSSTSRLLFTIILSAILFGAGGYYLGGKYQEPGVATTEAPSTSQTTARLTVDEQIQNVSGVDAVALNGLIKESLDAVFGSSVLIGVSETNNRCFYGCNDADRVRTEEEFNNQGQGDTLLVYDVKRKITSDDLKKLKVEITKRGYLIQESSATAFIAKEGGGSNVAIGFTADVADEGRFHVRALVY